MNSKYVVVTSKPNGPYDDLRDLVQECIGPFDTVDDTMAYIVRHVRRDWEILEVNVPNDDGSTKGFSGCTKDVPENELTLVEP